MASMSTFESLPDEILMLIFRFSGTGSVYSIFRSFSGLNQRFNDILVDRRLHLLADFLYIDVRASNFSDYYQSPQLTALSRRLGSLQSSGDKETALRRCLESLVSFHLQRRYHEAEQQFRSDREAFQLARANLTPEEIRLRDELLKKTFFSLSDNSFTLLSIRQVRPLVLKMGARLVCTNDELGEYNLAKAINPFMLYHVSYRRSPKQFSLHSFLEFFKALLVSNPSLLKNKDYVGNGGSTVYFFLIYWIYRLQDFYSSGAPTAIDIRRYQAVVDFFLFTVACLKDLPNENAWVTECLFDGLRFATSLANDIGEQIIIETSQMALLKILFDEMAERQIGWDEQCDASFKNRFRNLIRTERLDLILFIDRQGSLMSDFLNRSANFMQLIDMMTGSRAARRLLHQLLETEPPVSWLSSAKLLFVLLEKKECRSIRKLLQRIPTLIHRLDEEGNDPLLFVCLKVTGCRHRLVEFLVAMGSDWQRRNSQDEHFTQVLQHRKNRTLLERLIEHGVIAIDSVTGEFRVSPIEEQHAVGSSLPHQS